MEKIFKKINFFMGIISLISMGMFFLPFLDVGHGSGKIIMKEYILGTIFEDPHYIAFILLICPALILILHLLEHFDNKVSHQDLLYSIVMIIYCILLYFFDSGTFLIGFYIYAICAIILFVFSFIRFLAFKRL